jgi:predicted O-linked N-acetylglucosamine transferase (SPINDLY family)
MGFAWKSLVGLSDDRAAHRVREDAIDILVDLSGHTAHNRLRLFARKPAPVQVTWLGYPATTGLQAMDYILCDRYVAPANESDHFVEKPWYLPNTYLCLTPPQDEIAVGALPALTKGRVTFGCFNNLTKMNDAVVALWAQVLHAVPGSRLFLKTNQLNDPSLQRATLSRFADRGIAADRLTLEGASSHADYLATYNRVDIALDPFPFTGGTTSVEGLWMGVPVITKRGDRFIAHQGESILHNVGLPDWIAADNEAYVAIAVARAADLSGLATLRAKLRSRLLASPLCDAPLFARNLEAAFRGMWQAYCSQAHKGKPVAPPIGASDGGAGAG